MKTACEYSLKRAILRKESLQDGKRTRGKKLSNVIESSNKNKNCKPNSMLNTKHILLIKTNLE